MKDENGHFGKLEGFHNVERYGWGKKCPIKAADVQDRVDGALAIVAVRSIMLAPLVLKIH